jgi:hypothetical protein
MFSRKDLSSKESSDKKDEANEIGITGTVKLPKDWGSGSKAGDKSTDKKAKN